MGSGGRRNQALIFENELAFHESGNQSQGDGKQPLTLSELVASSTTEVLRCSDVNGTSQSSWTLDENGMNSSMSLPFERIRANFLQSLEEDNVSELGTALEKCGLCSQDLMQQSPWTSKGYAGNNDLPVVSVLACGHIFHADCLERSLLEYSKADPPCPECIHLEKAAVNSFFMSFGHVKHTIAPFRKHFVGCFRGKSKSWANKVGENMARFPRSLSERQRGLLSRSLSKLQAPLQAKPRKVSAPNN
ncbi:hypothetical protein KP509_24G063700 [Ceratopteris richardii]|nr:hypothetical protein KP509_24G063700 [Ceratopteris richardii]